MQKIQINFSHVLRHMQSLKNEFGEIVEELELLSNTNIRKQVSKSLKAENKGKTEKYSVVDFKKAIGL